MIIELTYPIHEGMFKYPSDPEPKINIIPATTKEEIDGGWSEGENRPLFGSILIKYKSGYSEVAIRNHHGTHIDAPAHKLPDGKKISDYPLKRFRNVCTLLKVPSKRIITLDDIAPLDLSKHQSPGLILYTGFCDEMEKEERKLTGQAKTDFEKKFPALSQETAEYLIKMNPNLSLLGIDSFSFDPQGSNSEAHRVFLKKDILLLETLVNLSELKRIAGENRFMLYSAPIPYHNADASQTRAFAITDEPGGRNELSS